MGTLERFSVPKFIKKISPEILQVAKNQAWSIESMAGHNASDRSVEYIGSSIGEERDDGTRSVMDFYKDSSGDWWYKNRIMLPSGKVVTTEYYILGHEMNDNRKSSVHKRNGEIQYG